MTPLQLPAKKRDHTRAFMSDAFEKENATLINVQTGPENTFLRIKKPTVPAARLPMTPGQRKVLRLEEKIRKLESKLYRAERQNSVHTERLVDLASENRTTRQELQDALDKGEAADERSKELQRERDQFHTWWMNELKFSQSLLDNGYPYLPGTPT